LDENDKIKEYIEAQAFSTQDKAELEAFRIKFLGSKGLLKDLFRVQECS
jgi:phenylalanyl-tRNA synthetase alpha chain